METSIKKYPPPWNLSGTGFIFTFLADKEAILKNSDMSSSDKNAYKGGLGAIILANYSASNAGPYSELLIIPGDFEYNGNLYKRITKIYVSTPESLENGKENWGIPKELAQFEWRRHGPHTSIKINDGARHIADLAYSTLFLSFPMDTSILPLSIVQEWKGKYLKTTPVAKGSAKLANLDHLYMNPAVFPAPDTVSKFYIPFGFSIENFSMVFPKPDII